MLRICVALLAVVAVLHDGHSLGYEQYRFLQDRKPLSVSQQVATNMGEGFQGVYSFKADWKQLVGAISRELGKAEIMPHFSNWKQFEADPVRVQPKTPMVTPKSASLARHVQWMHANAGDHVFPLAVDLVRDKHVRMVKGRLRGLFRTGWVTVYLYRRPTK